MAQFVALTQSSALSTAATTPDGVTWTPRTSLTDAYWEDVAFNGVLYVAAGGNGGVATSPDGITWTWRTTGLTATHIRVVVWTGTVWFVKTRYTHESATSTDGVTWVTGTLPATPSGYYEGGAWSGSAICLVDDWKYAYTSPTGLTGSWTKTPIPVGGWGSIAWNGVVFCALTIYGTGACITSPDGVVWSGGSIPNQSWMGIAWNGTVFCAVGGSTNQCATSPDGASWTARTLPSSNNWWAVAWNGAVFLASHISANTACATSPDGITWTARTASANKLAVTAGIDLTLWQALPPQPFWHNFLGQYESA